MTRKKKKKVEEGRRQIAALPVSSTAELDTVSSAAVDSALSSEKNDSTEEHTRRFF
jgi:hypothetical protein